MARENTRSHHITNFNWKILQWHTHTRPHARTQNYCNEKLAPNKHEIHMAHACINILRTCVTLILVTIWELAHEKRARKPGELVKFNN